MVVVVAVAVVVVQATRSSHNQWHCQVQLLRVPPSVAVGVSDRACVVPGGLPSSFGSQRHNRKRPRWVCPGVPTWVYCG